MKQILLLFFVALSAAASAQTGNTILCDSTVSVDANGNYRFKWIYSYDDRGNQTNQTYYYWTNGVMKGDINTYKEYDLNGNVTKSINYAWKDSVWVNYTMSDMTYDNQGRTTTQVSYSWKDSVWVGLTKYETIYNQWGVENFTCWNWKNGEWVGSYRSENTYDDNGNDVVDYNYQWSDSIWVNSSKTECSYNDNGKIVSYIKYNWNNDEWAGSSKETTEYDDQNRTTRITRYTMTNGEWINKSKAEYTFPEEGHTIYWAYTWAEDFWALSSKSESILEDNGCKLTTIEYEIDNPKTKKVYTYSDEKRIYLLNYKEYSYGTLTDDNTYTYDDNGNKIKEVKKFYMSTYVSTNVTEWTYNDQNQMTSYVQYYIDQKTQAATYEKKVEYTYNERGDLSTVIVYTTSSSSSKATTTEGIAQASSPVWYVSQTTTYYYSGHSTDIESIEAETGASDQSQQPTTRKLIENGQVVIVRPDGRKYTLGGQRME